MENFGLDNDLREKMIKECHEAKEKAYAPYSNFRVGAALVCDNDDIFQGCNVENVSVGLGLCAERSAIVRAVSDGRQNFKAIAITSDLAKQWTYPCGSCRQFMAEFSKDLLIYLVKTDSSYKILSIKDLLPYQFNSEHLDGESST